MQARAYWSALASSAFPIACSGAMYDGVPITVPVAVRPETESALRARPKSARRGRPAASRRTFPGLTSRWRIPFECAWSRAAAIAASHGTASAGGTGPLIRSFSEPPETRGMTRYETLLALRGAPSRSRRRRGCSGARAPPRGALPGGSARAKVGSAAIGSWMTLTATVRWRVWSSARQTSDIPPAPARSRRRYRPRRVPGVTAMASSFLSLSIRPGGARE